MPREQKLIDARRLSSSFILPLIVWVCLRSNLFSGLQKTHLLCNRVRIGRSKSLKVIHGQ